MRTRTLNFVFAALMLGASAPADAQQATERYIPIGASPGVSGEYSYTGEIVAVDMSSRTITVEDEEGRRIMRVNEDTRIWLDRSQRRRPALVGDYADCEVGRRVEIMHRPDDPMVAAWIKIETR